MPVDLAARPDIADIDDASVAVDGENDAQCADARGTAVTRSCQWLGVCAERILRHLIESGYDTTLHVSRNPLDVVGG